MEEVDLEAWEPESPPADFAERVLARAVREKRRRWRVVGAAAAVAAIAAAAWMVFRKVPEPTGEITADHRLEVPIGTHAVAVLDPGAHLSWIGSNVTQDRGGVFYRVERGAAFHVHTPVGEATVHGTCFGVVVETSTSTIALVAVYEGKVAMANGAQTVELSSGQTARADGNGVERGGDFDTTSLSAANVDDPYATANRNLVDQVADFQRRLATLEAQKKTLTFRLSEAQEKLAATGDGAATAPKNPFDLSQDDWKHLAEDGTIQYAIPCSTSSNGYTPGKDTLDKLGLAPQDATTIHDAYGRSTKRVWDIIRPLCAHAIGGSFEVADRLGADACVHVVLDITRQLDPHAVSEAMLQVAEIRAGERQAPASNDASVTPVEQIFLALTAEPQRFESDLAQTFGADEAHRIVFTKGGLVLCQSTFGGPGPRKP